MDYNSQQEAELRARLVNSIVNPQVIAPMEAANWSNASYQKNQMTGGQPAQSDAQPVSAPAPAATQTSDNPGQAATGTASAQPLDFEQFKDPANGLYAGKYRSPEELIKGMSNVVNMAKQAFTERDELRAKLAAIPATDPSAAREGASYSPAPAVPLHGGSTLDSVLNRIVEDGGVLDENNSKLLRDAVIELTETKARTVVSARELESQKWDAISTMMEAKYPGSINRADELHMYVQSHPEVATAVSALLNSGKEFEATEMAWRLMTSDFGQPVQPALTPEQVKETTLQAQDLVRQEAVDAARRDAGVLTTSGGGVHQSPPPSVSHDEIAAAAAIGHKTADWSAWRRAALSSHLDFDSPLFRG